MPKKLTTQEFVDKSNIIHNYKFDYSKSIYQGNRNKVTIICPHHGEFNQFAKSHLKGIGCKKCALEINSKKAQDTRRSDIDEFINKAEEIHGDKYCYSLSYYKNNKSRVKIICPTHGIFLQSPGNHLKGNGCPHCANDAKKSNTKKFIKESKNIHGNTYLYSATSYSSCYEKVIITCKKHGDFEQLAYSHKQGKGCPICSESHGERSVRIFLDNNNIEFVSQKTFSDCKNVFNLSFDFYLPELNLCIEYDGEQHFKPMGYCGGKKAFDRTIRNDSIKNRYCNNNDISLLRIRFDENVEEVLARELL